MTNPRDKYRLNRLVGMTYCAAGPYDLQPQNRTAELCYWDRLEDFNASACSPPPAKGQDWDAWTPAYLPDPSRPDEIRADLMVFDLIGYDQALTQWLMEEMELCSIFHPVENKSPAKRRTRLILILDQAVSANQYRKLWHLLANQFFVGVNLARSDFRTRFLMPKTIHGNDLLQSTDGNPLNVSAVLGLSVIQTDTVAQACVAPLEKFWGSSLVFPPASIWDGENTQPLKG